MPKKTKKKKKATSPGKKRRGRPPKKTGAKKTTKTRLKQGRKKGLVTKQSRTRKRKVGRPRKTGTKKRTTSGWRRQKISQQQKKQEGGFKIKKEAQILRGMNDIYGEDIMYWQYTLKKMVDLSEQYGFNRIIVPVLEKHFLFEKSTGITSDVVEKQMYTFSDRAGNKVVLRPEFTPSVVRAYIEQGMFNLPQPVKLYYFGPLFRYERPQAGRSRQFHQFGIEVIGSEKSLIDAQLILFSQTLFNNLGIRASIQINSLGCEECRKSYRLRLVQYFKFKKRWFCEDCKERLSKNPLRVFDCQKETCQKFVYQAPQLVDYLCEDCQRHFVRTLECLDEINVVYEFNPYLVRGLDYYTRTVFEFWPDRSRQEKPKKQRQRSLAREKFGAQIALGGGGRYDNVMESLGGRLTPATGLSYGIERIIDELKKQKIKITKPRAPQIFFAHVGEKASLRALKLFNELQKERFKIAENFAKDSLRQQLEIANKLRVKLALILGQEETRNNTIIIRDMNTGNQEVIDQERL
ncbi:histidine--tRNA ligase, partial [Patescibacteria group bacterium AH-259-L05]|nr:histidine--tRNA ligase [Patescibacteria group bacterium AH-259-L05]